MDVLPEHTDKLAGMLSKIGFRLRFCGCDHFLIMNKKGRPTQFEVFDDRITVRSEGTSLFGGYGRGGIGFNLRSCDIDYHEDLNFVSVHPKSDKNVFISFYGND